MNQPPQRPKTILTRLMQNGVDRIQFAKIKLKENARVPELRIQGPDDAEPQYCHCQSSGQYNSCCG